MNFYSFFSQKFLLFLNLEDTCQNVGKQGKSWYIFVRVCLDRKATFSLLLAISYIIFPLIGK